MRHDSRLRREVAITLHRHGKTIAECARITGYSERYVQSIVYEHGSQRKMELHKAMQIYKAEGHTREEVAQKFGVSTGTVTKVCRGIAPQRLSSEEWSQITQEQHKKTLGNREAKAIKQIERLGLEYVGGYTNTDGFVIVRCPRCGTEFERSMVSIRHARTILCPGCSELSKEEKRKQKEIQKEKIEKERIRKAEEKKKTSEEKEQAKWHKCPVCGEMTNRPKYCSKTCSAKAINKTREIKRDRKIKGALVDKDITLQRLYERDHGVCYLCGEVCDWDDKEERDGTIICGNRYPSIDHVVPLSRGGEHSWQNVRLAHRICNTRKGAKHQKIASSLTISE